MNIKEVDIFEIKAGDTVLCNDNRIRTVCHKDIKRDSFIGWTLFGDSYCLGHSPVKKVVLNNKKPKSNEIP